MESSKTLQEEVKPKLRGLSLFSGIGGIKIGVAEWVETKAYCEIDPYAQAVLKSRMADSEHIRQPSTKTDEVNSKAVREAQEGQNFCRGEFKGESSLWENDTGRSINRAKIYPDITKLHCKEGSYDIITGGFPCQDISNAGKRKGIHAERSGLWFEMLRLIDEVRPKYVFVENVSAIINRGLDVVLGTLSEIRYDAVWTTLRASDVGAPHRRERWFMLAYPTGELCKRTESERDKSGQPERQTGNGSSIVPNTSEQGLEGEEPEGEFRGRESGLSAKCNMWGQDPADQDPSTESYVGRVADGVPSKLDYYI